MPPPPHYPLTWPGTDSVNHDAAAVATSVPTVPPPAVRVDGQTRLREAFTAHYDFVWRSLRRLGVWPGSVDDAAQEVFMIFSRKVDVVEPGAEKSYLFGTALRIASDTRRAQSRRDHASDDALDRTADPNPTPDAALGDARARQLLQEVLDSLPLDVRAVFVLSELENLSAPEVAQTLGIPPGTVASRLRRGRELFSEAAKRVQATARREGGEA